MNAYIWRDALDKNQFWIGVKGNTEHYAAIPVFIDAMSDVFGNEAADWATGLKPGIPYGIEATLRPSEPQS